MKHVAYILRVCLSGARIYKYLLKHLFTVMKKKMLYYSLREYSYSFVHIA